MRTLILLTALMISSLSLQAAVSNPPEDLRIYNKVVDDQSLRIQLANLQREWTLVELEEIASGETYFEDRIVRHNGYLRKLDLSRLPEGRYLLSVSQADEEWSQVVVKKDGRLILSKIAEI